MCKLVACANSQAMDVNVLQNNCLILLDSMKRTEVLLFVRKFQKMNYLEQLHNVLPARAAPHLQHEASYQSSLSYVSVRYVFEMEALSLWKTLRYRYFAIYKISKSVQSLQVWGDTSQSCQIPLSEAVFCIEFSNPQAD